MSRRAEVTLALLCLAGVAQVAVPQGSPPSVEWYNHSDNVYARAVWENDSTTHHINYLGLLASVAQCEAACVEIGPSCRSFVYHGQDRASHLSFTKQCFGVMDGWFHPVPVANATTGKVRWCPSFGTKLACPPQFCTWLGGACVPPPAPPPPSPPPLPHDCPASPCTGDAGCSLNGVCDKGVCTCDAAWTGSCCNMLNFAPAVRGAGLHTVETDGHNTSSWGGTVLRDDKGVYHMWAAEMVTASN